MGPMKVGSCTAIEGGRKELAYDGNRDPGCLLETKLARLSPHLVIQIKLKFGCVAHSAQLYISGIPLMPRRHL